MGDPLFDALGFRWDRAEAARPLPSGTSPEALASYSRQTAGHVWAAAALEGNPFTFPEVQTLLDGVTVGGRRVSDEQQILRLRDAHVQLVSAVRSGAFALNKETSDALNSTVAPGEALEAGHFRGEGASLSNVSVNLGDRGTHHPPATVAGGAKLREIFERGTGELLAHAATPFEAAAAYFLFGALQRFYFDGNKRTARFVSNGLLLSAGIEAILIPAAARLTFNELMVDFYADRDGTRMVGFLAACGPDQARTRAAEASRAHADRPERPGPRPTV